MNRWGIPAWLEGEVRQRDKNCVYCRIPLQESSSSDGSRKAVATWEHIINDARIITRENIARCCASCNASKGTQRLSHWIESSYCKRRGITFAHPARVQFAASASEIPEDRANERSLDPARLHEGRRVEKGLPLRRAVAPGFAGLRFLVEIDLPAAGGLDRREARDLRFRGARRAVRLRDAADGQEAEREDRDEPRRDGSSVHHHLRRHPMRGYRTKVG